MFSWIWRWWNSHLRCWGKSSYIRFAPNPGFRWVYGKKEIKWNSHYGWYHGRIR